MTTTKTAAVSTVSHAAVAAASGGFLSEAEAALVNIPAGITDFFENTLGQLQAAHATVAAGTTTDASGAPLPSVTAGAAAAGGGFGNVLSEIESAIAPLKTFVSDLSAGNIAKDISDAAGLLTLGFGILTKAGVSIPGLTAFAKVMPYVASIASVL